MDTILLSLITFSPLLGIILLAFVPRDRGGMIKTIGMIIPLLPLILSLYLFTAFDLSASGNQFIEEVDWITLSFPIFNPASGMQWVDIPINFEFAVDGLSMVLVVLTAIISALAAVASTHIKRRLKEYFILFFILMIGMFGVFMAQNLLLFFIFLEIVLIPMFFLVGIWGYMERERAANRYLIYNGVGSAIMLITFIALFRQFGTFNINQLTSYLTNPEIYPMIGDGFRWGAFIAILIAFGIKLPIFPFHTWMLRVHVQAPPPVVMIHSGILLKMGAYGILRFGYGFFPDLAVKSAAVIAILGLINILYGATLAFVQRDMKMMLAYSSLSHMGIFLFGIAALNSEGFQGAIFQLVSHGFISALMFFLVAVIYERTNTSYIDELGGLAKSMPFASGILLAAAMASLGLPLTSGFISEFLAYLGLFGTDLKVIAAIGTLGLILTAAYLLRAVMRTTFGPTPEQWERIPDARALEVVPMIVLLGLIILVGVYPSVLGDPLQTTITDLLGRIGG